MDKSLLFFVIVFLALIGASVFVGKVAVETNALNDYLALAGVLFLMVFPSWYGWRKRGTRHGKEIVMTIIDGNGIEHTKGTGRYVA